MPFEIYAPRKRHHAVVNLAAMVAREEFIPLLSPDQRTGMENKSLWIKTKVTYAAIEVFYLSCNII